MASRKIISLSLVFSGFVVLIAFIAFQVIRSRQPTAGLKVETNPTALVFIDNQQVGKTPFEQLFRPSEVTVKLVPDSSSTTSALSSYQTKVRLTANTYTVIKRDFGSDDQASSGETVSLIAQPGTTASLSVVSSYPESASVIMDGLPQGFTPLSLTQVVPSSHQIQVSAPGFAPRTITAQAVAGYKLVIIVKLAALTLTPTPTPSLSLTQISTTPTPSLATPTRPYVTILNTPTGFLRVRSTPSTGGKEIGQIKPGQSFSLLNSQAGWYEIKVNLTATSSGWISSQYAKKFE